VISLLVPIPLIVSQMKFSTMKRSTICARGAPTFLTRQKCEIAVASLNADLGTDRKSFHSITGFVMVSL